MLSGSLSADSVRYPRAEMDAGRVRAGGLVFVLQWCPDHLPLTRQQLDEKVVLSTPHATTSGRHQPSAIFDR